MSLHIGAEKGQIAKVVLMPGDPIRAQAIAKKFLTDVEIVSEVRGANVYTGFTKNGKRISVMPSGMGMPSMGIYSHELFVDYGVELIIRVGTCGAYQSNIKLMDVIIASVASADTAWQNQYNLSGTYSAGADFIAANQAYVAGLKKGFNVKAGNVLSADVFYDENPNLWKSWAKLGILAVEMESYSLYCNAARFKKKALTLLTVTDHFVTGEKLSTEDRATKFEAMVEIALEVGEKYA